MYLTTQIARLKRRLKRYQKMEADMKADHNGKERNFTYHGGWSLGYVQGKISEIEERIWDLEELQAQKSPN